MIHSRVRQALTALNLSDYVAAQRSVGRFDLDPEFVRHWADQYRAAASLLKRLRPSPELAEALLLFREVTYPMAMQERSRIPSYYPYTCVNILDWYMGDCGEDLEALKKKSVIGIVALLLDLGRFETHSLIGYEPFQPSHFEPELAAERIRVLKDVYAATVQLSGQVPGSATRLPLTPRTYDNVIDYAAEPGRFSALLYFSCMPQTRFHDEVLFLRSIHISELCFYGIRIAVVQAREAIGRGALATARACLEQAIAFGEVLHQTFRVVRTMPPAHFLDFRESAANASAVQSANYQLMDVHLFGLSQHKLALFQRIPHLRNVLRYYHPGFVCLRDLLQSVSPDGDGGPLLETARQLDHKLLTWRGLHVGFAQLYLADIPVGTGGTSGAAYLKLFLRNTLFGETRIDPAAAGELSEACAALSDTEVARPGMYIAPPRDLIGPDKLPATEPAE
jgi:tryptophan 2,3-dioxygenase